MAAVTSPALSSAPAVPLGLAAIPPGDHGAQAPLDARAMQRLGGLERAAAALLPAFAGYREALAELVPAYHAVAGEGARPGAPPDTLVPQAARAALAAGAARLAGWHRPSGVPSLAWAVHEDLLDQLEEAAAAVKLRHLLAPSQALLQAFERQVALCDELLQLLGSRRAMGVFNVDDAAVAQEAHRTGARAQERLRAAAHGGAATSALSELEVSLSEALDAAAFAAASGASTAEQLGSSYLPLSQVHRSVVGHVAELARALAAMAAAPPPAAAQLVAELRQPNEEVVEAELRWLPPGRPHEGASQLQISRRVDVVAAREVIDAQAACGALSLDAAAEATTEVLALEAPQTVAIKSGDASGYKESLPLRFAEWPWLYRVVATSAFGVEAHAHEVRARPAFDTLQPPRRPRARLLTPRYDDPSFYRLGDAVEVSWARSPSDPAEADGDAPGAGAASLTGYEVYRLSADAARLHAATDPALAPLVPQATGGLAPPLRDALPTGWRWVGTVDAGEFSFVDRPTLAQLAEGVSYVVVATGDDGLEARVPGRCGQSEPLHQDLSEVWRLASSGAARARVPGLEERRLAQELATPEKLASAVAAFAARPESAQQAVWQQYWSRLPEAERQKLRERLPAGLSEAQAAEGRARGYLTLCERLHRWAQLNVYAQAQPSLRRAAAQHWQLLTLAERQAATRSLGHALGARLMAATTAATPGVGGAVEADVQLWTYWQGRDEQVRQALAAFWEAVGASAQATRLASWWGTLDDAQRDAATWPEPALLAPEERAAWLTHAPWPVPQQLQAPLMAFLAYDALPAEAKRRAIANEVGPVWRAVEAVHYAVRPFDAWTHFKLPRLLGLLGVGLVAGWLVQQLSARKGGDNGDG